MPTATNKPTGTTYLEEHGKRFEKRIEKVTEGVYSAIGYSLANSILLVTEVGNIIVDTTESMKAANEIKEEFDKISPQPTVAIIYTHGHTDHTHGASVFMEEDTVVYANAKTKEFFYQQFNQLQPILNRRGLKQFGIKVPKEYIQTSALGPYLNVDGKVPKLVLPTHDFEESMELNIGGLKLILVSAPGETDDQIFIWMPEKKVLLSADNYYPCFPNLYTIRGTTPRPVYQWVESLDKMRDLGAEYLVPCHTEPLYGKEKINEMLTMYRDAIQFVHDSVVRGMNEGKTPDELVDEIKLTPHLLAYKELRELYGDIGQAVRAIYSGYLGWFDGNATNLVPLPHKIRAQNIIDLAGGSTRIFKEIKMAITQEEYQWATEMADILLTVNPEWQEVLLLKAESLFQLGLLSQNSNNRSYYLAESLLLKGEIQYSDTPVKVELAYANAMPIEKFFSNMTVRLNPVKSLEENISASVRITDSTLIYQIHVRNGVAEIRQGNSKNLDLTIETTGKVWKETVLGVRDAQVELDSGQIKLQGEVGLFCKFIDMFH